MPRPMTNFALAKQFETKIWCTEFSSLLRVFPAGSSRSLLSTKQQAHHPSLLFFPSCPPPHSILDRVFTAAQILAIVFISVAMVPLTMAFLGRVDKTERWAKRVLTICSGFFQLLAVSLATSHYVDVRQNYDFRQDFPQGIAGTTSRTS